MSKFEKAKEKLRLKPKDYTYTEAKALLFQMGFLNCRYPLAQFSDIIRRRKEIITGKKWILQKNFERMGGLF